ncbi:MAG: AraC family transcriptional regulator ligand-binding domain-containing protein [Gammaproteobacteria bacterium]|nr:AraC family transcriptional regulator ligand-binding domain-containing protein [Gammaproteobacteria bacterium]
MATIGKHYIEAACYAAKERGVDTNTLIMMAGFAPSVSKNKDQRISDISMVRLLNSLKLATNDGFLGFSDGQVPVNFFELLLQSLGYCQNVEQSLSTLKTGLALAQCQLLISYQADEVKLKLVHQYLDPEHFLLEYLLVFIHRILSWLTGRVIPIFRAEINYRPTGYLPEFEFLFRCPVVFDTIDNALVFKRQWLALSIVRQRDELAQVIAEFPMVVLRYPGDELQLSRLLYQQIVKVFFEATRILTASEAALRLAMSPATLRRQLASQSTSFSQIKAEFCKEQALRLLVQDQSIEQIAYCLGYSESRAFSRAFKQWTGLTPSQYRVLKTNTD